MKNMMKVAKKVAAKIKSNKEDAVKLAIFAGAIILASVLPLVSAYLGVLALMVAIDHRKEARKSLEFMSMPGRILREAKDEVVQEDQSVQTESAPEDAPVAAEEKETEAK